MSRETSLTVKVGTKLTEAEMRAIDPKDVGQATDPSEKAGVEGQADGAQDQYWTCPYCGCLNKVAVVSGYRFYNCHCCAVFFRV
jgi:hypothetical protein